MELLFILIVLLFVLWVTGMLKGARQAVDMANLEIKKAHAVHKDRVIGKLDLLEVDVDKAARVKEKLALLDSIEL